jgi:subtilisin
MKAKKALAAALLPLLISIGTAFAGNLNYQIPQNGSNRVVLSFKSWANDADKQTALQKLGAHEVEEIPELGLIIVETPSKQQLGFTTLSDYALTQDAVAFAQEDTYMMWLPASVASSDNDFANSLKAPLRKNVPPAAEMTAVTSLPTLPQGLNEAQVPWGVRRVKAPWVWPKDQGDNVNVAVIDTGIDSSHTDLAGRVKGCYDAIDKTDTKCTDQTSAGGNPGHGTHVSGTIAGQGVSPNGVFGVAPKVNLFAVRVLDSNGGGGPVGIAKGILWCAKNNIQVANMSLGTPIPIFFIHWAIDYATKKGVVFVAAAGNSGKGVDYPAKYDNVIAVSADGLVTVKTPGQPDQIGDQISSWSSRGDKVEFIAPGVGVLSTLPGGKYDTLDGTSMASPHVTGLAALAIKAQGIKPGPNSLAQVRAALRAAATKLPGIPDSDQGFGMIDATKLIR